MLKHWIRISLAACLACASPGFVQPAQADMLADIKKAGVINVGVFEDFPPFSSVGTDMALRGYDIEFADAIAKALGVTVKLVPVTGQNRIPSLQGRKVDILLSVGKSAERERVVDFTAAYAPYYIAMLGPRSLKVAGPSDLVGKTVGVNRGTLEDTSLTEIAPAATDIRRFDSYNGVISAFLAGQVQLIVVGNDVGSSVLARRPALEPEQKFQLMKSPDHVALSKNEPALKQALDDVITAMRSDGSLNRLSLTWLLKPLDLNDL